MTQEKPGKRIGTGATAEIYARGDDRVLKLYRSWVPTDWMRHEARSTQIAHSLGLPAVAEGIETADEFQAVCDAGAHFGQGFLFARPSFPRPNVVWPPAGGDPLGPLGTGNSMLPTRVSRS